MNTNKKFIHFTLSNGIETVVYPIKEINAVSIQLGMPFGSVVEKKGDIGTLHFLEHLMFEGSKKFPTVHDVSSRGEELGVSFNAGTGPLDTRFWFMGPDNTIPDTLDFIMDTIANPLFTEAGIDKNRRVILTEQRNHWDVPEYQFSFKALAKRIGEIHPYTRRGFGQPETVQEMTKEKLLACYQKFYTPKHMKLSIAGNVEIDKLRSYLEETLGSWKKEGKVLGKTKPEKPVYKPLFFLFPQSRKQVQLILSFPLNGFKEYDLRKKLSLNIFDFLLGRSLTSPLHMKLREELGLVYSIYSSRAFWPYLGMFEVRATADSENLRIVFEEIWKVLETIKERGFGEENFKRAISYINAQTLARFAGAEMIASYFLDDLVWEEDILLPEDYIKVVNKITLEEVNSLGKEVLNFGLTGLALMGDENAIQSAQIENNFNARTR